MKFTCKLLAIAVVGLLFAGSAFAGSYGTITAINDGYDTTYGASVQGNSTYATALYWHRAPNTDASNSWSTASLALGQKFTTFCIDNTRPVGAGWTANFIVADLADASQMTSQTIVDRLTRLFINYVGFTSASTAAAGARADAALQIKNAAFQATVWELIYGTSAVTGLSSAVQSLTNNMYSSVTAAVNGVYMDKTGLLVDGNGTEKSLALTFADPGQKLYALVNAPGGAVQEQAFFIAVSTPPPLPVPTPAVMGAGLVLLAGVVAKRLRGRIFQKR